VKVWIDAQLSPAIARWLATTFGEDAVTVKDVGLRDAEDEVIFNAARKVGAVVMTKDVDFADLVRRLGPPPQILWITCGNTSNARLMEILKLSWPRILDLLRAGERLVEVSDRTT
jgi:predicted nuclease of predicted toxin-antitoxin system